MINRQTYEEYFLLYTDGELNAAERAEVEKFVKENPELKMELDALSQSVFVADEKVVFENKEVLYQEERKGGIVFFPWVRFAAAAAVLILLGAGAWQYFGNKPGHRQPDAAVAMIKDQRKKPISEESGNHPSDEQRSLATTSVPINNRETKHPQANLPATANDHPSKNHKAKNKSAASENIPAEQLQKNDPDDIALESASDIVKDVAMTGQREENISIPVTARKLGQGDNTPRRDNIQYADGDDISGENRVYFANTSFSKRNGLRIVFRKASRIIDRITTLQ